MGCLFQRASKLESINFSNFDTSKTKDLGYMFSYCTNLKSLNLSSFDTSQVIYFWYMFLECTSLLSLNISNFDTSKAIKIRNMFNGCSNLIFLDISNFDISNIPNDDNNLNDVFLDCNSLNFINIYNFKGQSVDMFQTIPDNCFSNILTVCYKYETTGTLKNKNAKNICSLDIINNENIGKTISVTFNITEDNGKSIYYIFHSNDYNNINHLDSLYINGTISNSYINSNSITLSKGMNTITMVFKDEEQGEVRHLFKECGDILSIDFSNFNMTKITDISYFFKSCINLETIDLSNFDLKNVNNIAHMFDGCIKLKSLNISNFYTSNVKYFDYMFYGCNSLKSLDISNFDISNELSIAHAFDNCFSLDFINLYLFKGKEGKDFFLDIPDNCFSNNLKFCHHHEIIDGILKTKNAINICSLNNIINKNKGKIITAIFNIPEDDGNTVHYINSNNLGFLDSVYVDDDTYRNYKEDNSLLLSKGIHTVTIIFKDEKKVEYHNYLRNAMI